MHKEPFKSNESSANEPHKRRNVLPSSPSIDAIQDVSQNAHGVHAVIDNLGNLRHLRTESSAGLVPGLVSTSVLQTAIQALCSELVVQAFGFGQARFGKARGVDVINGELEKKLGIRVDIPQTVLAKLDADSNRQIELTLVNRSASVWVSRLGVVDRISASLRPNCDSISVGKLISKNAAKENAKAAIFKNLSDELKARLNSDTQVSYGKVKLMALESGAQVLPVYAVLVSCFHPRVLAVAYVHAESGKVLEIQNKLRYHRLPNRAKRNAFGKAFPGKGFRRTPDAKVPVAAQVKKIMLDGLPESAVLANDLVEVYVYKDPKNRGDSPWELVKAISTGNDAGTFNYDINSAEFSGVISYWAANQMLELYMKAGMAKPKQPIKIFVDDPEVVDNAYFDPDKLEIHLGVGSNPPRGMIEHIAHDLSVITHELGHYLVYLLTPAHDLHGDHGAAIHESTGDVLGSLNLGFMWRAMFFGLSKKEMDDDKCIIGELCYPPMGIRKQKNKRRSPKDEGGQPHYDGLISGGAKRDIQNEICMQMQLNGLVLKEGKATWVEWASRHSGDKPEDIKFSKESQEILEGLDDFRRLAVAAYVQFPTGKVHFVDMLEVLEIADKKLFDGHYQKVIVDGCAAHGIERRSLFEQIKRKTGRAIADMDIVQEV